MPPGTRCTELALFFSPASLELPTRRERVKWEKVKPSQVKREKSKKRRNNLRDSRRKKERNLPRCRGCDVFCVFQVERLSLKLNYASKAEDTGWRRGKRRGKRKIPFALHKRCARSTLLLCERLPTVLLAKSWANESETERPDTEAERKEERERDAGDA